MAQPTQSYVYFNSGITVDVVKVDYIKKGEVDEAGKPTTPILSFEEALNQKEQSKSNTILFNTFNKMIPAIYVSPDGKTMGARFGIYRKTPLQTYYDFICWLGNGEVEILDYNIKNGEWYHYLSSVEVETSSGPEYAVYQNKEPDGNLRFLKVGWDSWSITDIEEDMENGYYVKKGNTWLLRCNIQGEDINLNTSVTVWDTLGKYAKISEGKKNYSSGSLTCLLGDVKEYVGYSFDTVDEQTQWKDKETFGYTERMYFANKKATPAELERAHYSKEIEKYNAWRNFITNGSLKLLKDTKGNSWIVATTEGSTMSVDIRSGQMPTMISFQWQEVEDVDAVSIIQSIVDEKEKAITEKDRWRNR